MALRFRTHVGDSRKRNPVPLRLRSPFIPRDMGGAEGYRGRGWPSQRKKALVRDRFKSVVDGFSAEQGGGLQVDHIQPFRYGGSNRLSNMRTVSVFSHAAVDLARGARERPPIRDPRW